MTTTTHSPADERKQAAQYLTMRRNLIRQAGIYVATVAFMITIWAVGGHETFWPVWIIIGGAFGLVTQAMSVYEKARPITEADVENELERRNRSH